MSGPLDPEIARVLAEQVSTPGVAGLLRRSADEAERVARQVTAAGSYARRGIEPFDPVYAARLADGLRAVEADRDLVAAILGSQPERRGVGIDWDALGLDGIPDYIDPADPVLAALRELEPPGLRAWRHNARPAQLPPAGSWLYWLIMAGRGFGKTWTGANALAEMAVQDPGDYALVAPTFGDARKICVEETKSGLLTALGDDLVDYNKSDYIVYVRGGSRVILASADVPDRLRGYNFRGGWCDELASFKAVRALWDEALLPALRIGRYPRLIVTTTPRRGNDVLLELLDRAGRGDPEVVVSRGKTSENLANLSEVAVAALYRKHGGTTLGRQELDGELLPDVEGALIRAALIELTRIRRIEDIPPLRRIVVGVDPSGSEKKTGDRCGIVVVGVGPPPVGTSATVDGEHLYFLEDASVNDTPERWARRVLDVADEWNADAIVPEQNNGSDIVKTMVRLVAKAEKRRLTRIIPAWASVNKRTRAEPVVGVWEQHRAHVVGTWPEYEDCWTGWVPAEGGDSPDPLDAGVWGAVNNMPELAVRSRMETRIIV